MIIAIGCKADDLAKKKMNDILPDIVGQEALDTFSPSPDDFPVPDVNFENATYQEIEEYYRKTLTRGAVYFLGFDMVNDSQHKEDDTKQDFAAPERHSIFCTGNITDQLNTIAFKFGARLYRLNDDFYILRDGFSDPSQKFNISSVFVSQFDDDSIQKLLTLYNLTGQSLGLQLVVRGSLLDIVDFKKSFDALQTNASVYLIDLAFIDFTIDETTEFEAYLVANELDILHLSSFSDLFSAYLNLSVDDLRSRNFYSQSLLSADGKTSTFNVGTSHSREQRSISDQGTSTVASYNDISDGFQLTFTPSNCLDSRVFCTLQLENSAFTDKDYSTKSETRLNVETVPFELGKTYYISSLTNFGKKRNISLFGLTFRNSQRVQTCWARIRKIK